LSRSVELQFTLTCFFVAIVDAQPFIVTNVYAPCDAALRSAFFSELEHLATLCSDPWLVLGDFNLARSPADKNNDNFDAAGAALFNDTVNSLLL